MIMVSGYDQDRARRHLWEGPKPAGWARPWSKKQQMNANRPITFSVFANQRIIITFITNTIIIISNIIMSAITRHLFHTIYLDKMKS